MRAGNESDAIIDHNTVADLNARMRLHASDAQTAAFPNRKIPGVTVHRQLRDDGRLCDLRTLRAPTQRLQRVPEQRGQRPDALQPSVHPGAAEQLWFGAMLQKESDHRFFIERRRELDLPAGCQPLPSGTGNA